MGKHQLRLLKFAIHYPGWHSYGKDQTTVSAVKSLVNNGLLKVNESRQFTLNLIESWKTDELHSSHATPIQIDVV